MKISSGILKMEAIRSSETLVITYNTTQRQRLEDHKPQVGYISRVLRDFTQILQGISGIIA
jgi:hypothetical protein